MFTDRIVFRARAGKGGNGIIAWRREKYLPKGGPYGGNGGRGGDIVIEADPQLQSLDSYWDGKLLTAENGVDGGSNNRQGRNGKPLILKVPCGTLVKEHPSGVILADLMKPGDRILLCTGGGGGRGNTSFKSSTNRAPNKRTLGIEGDEKRVELELKLIAEIGLVGFPNAGKSTLLNALTRVGVKTAPYPFTTIHPSIGSIPLEEWHHIYVADIPGIIEGAAKNRGLGLEFLRHIERTELLLYVLDTSGIDGRTPWDDWNVLQQEIAAYSQELLQRPYFILLNKIDDPASAPHVKEFFSHFSGEKEKVFSVSALDEETLVPLVAVLRAHFS